MPTTTELTENYIAQHLSIKECLKRGLINYSALARHIAKELNIQKTTSKEAILIAAIRYREKIKPQDTEKHIAKLVNESSIELKNNIMIYILDKSIYPDSLIEIEKAIKKERGLFFAVEGTKTITLIVQKNYAELISKRFKASILNTKENLSLIILTTSTAIEHTPGIVSYISGLFFEHGVNIEEFTSCYDDTLIVINTKDISNAMTFLPF